MSSGGGKSQTTVNQSGPPAWAQPYFQAFLNRANDSTNVPYQPYQGPRIAGFTDDQLAGFDMVREQAGGGNQLLNQANNYVSGQLSGQNAFTAGVNPYQGAVNPYANGANPYLGQMVADAQADVTRSYNNSALPSMMSQFSAGGAYGGSAHQQAMAESQRQLADQLGQVSTGLRSADYDRRAQLTESGLNRNAGLAENYLGRQQDAWSMNRGQELAALGMVPTLNSARYDDARALMNIGQQQQNLWQGLYDQGYQDFAEGRDWEQKQIGLLADALGRVNGGSSSQTGPNPNYTSAAQNTAAMATALAALWG